MPSPAEPGRFIPGLLSGFTVDGWNLAPPGMYETPINNGIHYLSTGAGFQPSTVHPLRIGLWDPFQMAISMAKKMMVILTTCKSWDVPPSSRWCLSLPWRLGKGWRRCGGDSAWGKSKIPRQLTLRNGWKLHNIQLKHVKAGSLSGSRQIRNVFFFRRDELFWISSFRSF